VYYKPEYAVNEKGKDVEIPHQYFYNYYELLDLLSVKLLANDYAKQELKDRRELVQETNN